MEFHEKLQQLRKSRGLTQEELAEAVYVSRTAVSKWESGRGYPSIDSLKQLARFFSISVDELLSGEKLLSIAKREHQEQLASLCDLGFGIADACSFLLMILPLYPEAAGNMIRSVTLFAYAQAAPFHRFAYWVLFVSLFLCGFLQLLLVKTKKNRPWLKDFSMGLSILTVLFLAMGREAYAVTVAFLLLTVKGSLLFKRMKAGI